MHRHRKKTGLLAIAAVAGTMTLAMVSGGTAHATIVVSGYDTATSTGSIGPAAPGDPITTKQMIQRAHDWIDQSVPYSQTEGWEDNATGGPYRMDCSGFVSMAWGLQTSEVTSTLPSVATVTDSDISRDANLQPGDALDYTADHVVLFDSWIDVSSGEFHYDAEHQPGVLTNQSIGNIDGSDLEGYPISDFEALRYNNIKPTGPATAYAVWMGGPDSGNALWEASGAASGSLSGPNNRGMGPLNSAPALAVGPNGYIYAYWEGGPDSGNALWEAYYNGSSWQGPFDRGMGPLYSQPTVAVSDSGTAYVFWEGGPGSGNALWEANGNPTGSLNGPYKIGMGPLDSAPTAGIDANGNIAVYWKGGPDSGNDLWEAYWNGSSWAGPNDRGMGPLNSGPTVAVSADGTSYVFWEGGPDSGNALFQAQGPAGGSLSGPYKRGMGPLNSAPSAGVDDAGNTYVYWEGGPDSGNALWEAFWNGSAWVGPYDRGMGPLDSQPAVAITG